MGSPRALTKLSISIAEIFKTFKPQILLFDSLFTILIYEKENTVLKFVHSLSGRIRLSGCAAIFIAQKGQAESELIKDLNLFIDKVIKF